MLRSEGYQEIIVSAVVKRSDYLKIGSMRCKPEGLAAIEAALRRFSMHTVSANSKVKHSVCKDAQESLASANLIDKRLELFYNINIGKQSAGFCYNQISFPCQYLCKKHRQASLQVKGEVHVRN